MKSPVVPLYKKLRLENKWWNYEQMERSIEISARLPSKASDYDRAVAKRLVPFSRFLLSLACYYAGELELAREHAKKCLEESVEFFFGNWRNTYKSEDGKVDPAWWKRHTDWMGNYECVLLWGSVLGEWKYLENIGAFPEGDSDIALDCTRQDRDLYVAVGRFLAASSNEELEMWLGLAETGPSEYCTLVAQVIRAARSRDRWRLQETLIKFLEYYKLEEFPQERFTAKISIWGTLFVRWAENECLNVNVPAEFTDYIVKL
jgi:hypothetical protein